MPDFEMSVVRARAESGDSDTADQLIESAAEQGDWVRRDGRWSVRFHQGTPRIG